MSKKLFYYGSTQSFLNLYSNNLDGSNEWVNMTHQAAFSFTDGITDLPFSGSAFIKADTLDANGRGIFGKSNSISANREWFFFTFSGGLRLRLETAGATAAIQRQTNNSLLSTGVWYYVGWSYDGSELNSGMKIYYSTIGGTVSEVGTTNNNSGAYLGMTNTITLHTIGCAWSNPSLFFDGKIFHPALWNKSLSLAEHQEICNKLGGDLRTVSCAANLIYALRFPTGTGDYPTWSDYSGNGHNGTMTNQEAADINTDIPT